MLDLRGKDAAVGPCQQDQGHIIDWGALPEKKEASQSRKAKASPTPGVRKQGEGPRILLPT